jgi:hypothetical protein
MDNKVENTKGLKKSQKSSVIFNEVLNNFFFLNIFFSIPEVIVMPYVEVTSIFSKHKFFTLQTHLHFHFFQRYKRDFKHFPRVFFSRERKIHQPRNIFNSQHLLWRMLCCEM